jgi:hypothetical protein
VPIFDRRIRRRYYTFSDAYSTRKRRKNNVVLLFRHPLGNRSDVDWLQFSAGLDQFSNANANANSGAGAGWNENNSFGVAV